MFALVLLVVRVFEDEPGWNVTAVITHWSWPNCTDGEAWNWWEFLCRPAALQRRIL